MRLPCRSSSWCDDAPVFDRSFARKLALARFGLGLGLLAAPASAPGPLVPTEEAGQPWPKLLARMLGAREIALALWTLRALHARRDEHLVLAVAALCDAVDGLSSANDRALSPALRGVFAGTAFPTAAAEVVMAVAGLG